MLSEKMENQPKKTYNRSIIAGGLTVIPYKECFVDINECFHTKNNTSHTSIINTLLLNPTPNLSLMFNWFNIFFLSKKMTLIKL